MTINTDDSDLTVLQPGAQYGELPFDKFLIDWWDSTALSSTFLPFSRLPEEIQRAIEAFNTELQLSKLRQLYIETGGELRQHYIPDLNIHPPPPTQPQHLTPILARLLPALNTIQERNLMLNSMRDGIRVLRTCYRSNHNETSDSTRHQSLLKDYAEWYAPPSSFLSDPSRYSALSSDYERIFQIMPGLLCGLQPLSVEERLGRYVENLEDMPPLWPIGGNRIARDSIVSWIQIEDEPFFDGEPVLLVYYDQYGKTCVSLRDNLPPALQFGAWSDGCWRDSLDGAGDEGMDYAEDGRRTKEWEGRVRREMVRLGKDEEVEKRWQEQLKRENQGGRKRQYAGKSG